jgi:hypothetical protein
MSAREELIEAGLLQPRDVEPYPASVARVFPPGFERAPILRLDDRGRWAAARRIKHPEPFDSNPTALPKPPVMTRRERERFTAPRAIGRAA